eukprot:CAMPEP_0206450028 /NCGR_PEP_ID=MMETSP0324_2-20121206/18463_1 /ASSEMBLY_ACC=CAM_ASM_000836 /TAXON_ID=2866 /ORGANISM="Crypthecodinium cohnii, Strain Seligo" /LENGTH=696 /DNA_ID=CAMNT_0053919563 /DNA_START=116 /DNA_END=2202 /DNA_ORIENTATION=-
MSFTSDPDARELRLLAGTSESESLESGLERNFVHPVEVPGRLGPRQLDGEHISSDPDWPPGCWLSSYMVMHRKLIAKARSINAERLSEREEQQAAAGQEDVTISSSVKLLRTEVFSLCPLHFLYSGMVVSIILTILTFCTPYVQGKLVDAVVAGRERKVSGEPVDEWAVMSPLLLMVALLTFASYWCEILVGILFAISGHTTVTRLRIKLFRNLTIQDVAFFDNHVSGELSSRLINDSAALSSLTQFTSQTLLQAVVKFTGAIFAMYLTHPWLALIATIITPLNTFLVKRTGMIVGHYGTVQNSAMAKANAVAIEVLGNIRTVQSNVGETDEAFRFMDRLNHFLRVIKGTVYLETVLRFTQYGLTKAKTIVVLGVAMHEIIQGGLTIGQYTAFVSYVTMFEDGFQNLADIWINFKQTITSTGKFVQLLQRKPRIAPEQGLTLQACQGEVTFKDVRFCYEQRPETPVLACFQLKASPGSIVALVGESGAGKTTVGRLLLRYYDPTSGAVLLDGKDLRSLDLWWLRSQMGVVEQEPVLFDRSLKENIAYGSSSQSDLRAVRGAARTANAENFILDLPGGYDTIPGERAARISGGQKQRVAIARAVLRNPKVLLLDEATSALDSENEHQVQLALDQLMRAKMATTFVIAHRLSTVRNATTILVLHKGQVVEQGSHDELIALSGKYASFMQHQLVSSNPS